MNASLRAAQLISLIALSAVCDAMAQPPDPRAVLTGRELARQGLENVAIAFDAEGVVAAYENTIYRDEIGAMRRALGALAAEIGGDSTITVIPQRRGIGLMAVTVPANSYRAYERGAISGRRLASMLEISLDTKRAQRRLHGARTRYSSLRKLDLVVHPEWQARFGNFSKPVQSQFNLAPEVRMTVWTGMSLTGRAVLSVYDELGLQEEIWRPGIIALNQTFRLPATVWISTTVGRFSDERYGFDLEGKKYFGNGRWALGANVGYTGHLVIEPEYWLASRPELVTYLFSAEYRIAPLNSILQVDYGRFLYEDRGWRAQVVRQFGELDLGFFAVHTDRGLNGGLVLSVPLIPSRALRLGSVRIRPARAFDWEYRYHRLPTVGIQYRTDNRLSDFPTRLHPDYVRQAFVVDHHEDSRDRLNDQSDDEER